MIVENRCSELSANEQWSDQCIMAYIMDIHLKGSYGLPGAQLLPLSPSSSHSLFPGEFDKRKALGKNAFSSNDITRFPKVIEFTSAGATNAPDFLYISAFEGLVVSQRARAILEFVDPEPHNFIPLDHSRMPSCAREAGYSYLILTTVLDAVDIDRSEIVEDKFAKQLGFPLFVFERPNVRCSIRRSVHRGHHIWVNKRPVVGSHIFISDKLKDAWEAAGCGPMQYLPCEDVD